MDFLKQVINKAKEKPKKTIVLPEGFDKRIPECASMAVKEDLANIIILGKPDEVKTLAGNNDISKVEIIDHLNSDKFQYYVNQFYELRKDKGMTLEKAEQTLKNPLYFAAMMVKNNDADGMVAGAANSTADTLRCCLQTVKTAKGVKILSTATVMVSPNKNFGTNGITIFSDTALHENPNAEELSQIAISSADFYKTLTGAEPKVAMLSYSTKGSATSEYIKKVADAVEIIKQKEPNLLVDGELQFDTAINSEVAKLKAPNSILKGEANVLIFPNLDSANIGCKIAEHFGNCELYGPVSQGLARPINDLSRACNASGILGMVAMTILQA